MSKNPFPGVDAHDWPTLVECPRCKGPNKVRCWEGVCWLCDDLGFVTSEDAAEFFRNVREEESHL